MRFDQVISLLIVATVAEGQFTTELEKCNGGYCMPVYQCPSALEDIKRGRHPEHCGFQQSTPIVCCKRFQPGVRSDAYCNLIHPRPDYPILAAVGGKPSLAQEFPHMAALGYSIDGEIIWACGGSLISEKFVLTAAHCIRNVNTGEVKVVRVGDLNLKRTDDVAEPQDFNVIRRIVHPGYKPPSQYNDLALLELDRPAKFTSYVSPACLQTEKTIPEFASISATGWGKLAFAGETADHLQKVILKVVNGRSCHEHYEDVPKRKLPFGIDDNTQLCAGADDQDTCQGDSGGPLQYWSLKFYETFTVIGITSFGKACGLAKTPGVYTRVSNFVPWIESVIWPI